MTTFDSPLIFAPSAHRYRSPLASWLAHLIAGWRRWDPRQEPLTLVLRARTASSVVVKGRPHAVECVEGLVWVTHDAVSGDHVLTARQRLFASGRGRIVVFAFAPSRVVLEGVEQNGEVS